MDNQDNKEDQKKQADQKCQCDLGATFGFLLLRLWLAVRSIMTGVEKYAGTKSSEQTVTVDGEPVPYADLTEAASSKVYGPEHYHGVPEALYGQFEQEPLIPGWGLEIYDLVLGPVLIGLGITLLLGIATRISLFAMGLLYVSLTVGLILLGQDAGISWLAVHIIMIAMALYTVKHNRFECVPKY
jgi:thiosulfate dehydrogenase [quinone] large subunit